MTVQSLQFLKALALSAPPLARDVRGYSDAVKFYESARRHVPVLVDELERLRQQVERSTKVETLLRDEIEAMEKDQANLRTQIAAQRERIDSLDSKSLALLAERDSLRKALRDSDDALAAARAEAGGQIEKLRRTLQRVREDLVQPSFAPQGCVDEIDEALSAARSRPPAPSEAETTGAADRIRGLLELAQVEIDLLAEIERLAYAATANGVFADYPGLAQDHVRSQVDHRTAVMRGKITPHLMIRLLAHVRALRTAPPASPATETPDTDCGICGRRGPPHAHEGGDPLLAAYFKRKIDETKAAWEAEIAAHEPAPPASSQGTAEMGDVSR